MNNRTDNRNHNQSHFLLSKRNLLLTAFAAIFAVGISAFALYTQPEVMDYQAVAKDEMKNSMPTLKGASAVEYLKGNSDYSSLSKAFTSIAADDQQHNPEATVKLTASDGVQSGYFGFNVAISGDTAVIGATNLPQGNGGSIPGAAYIFVRNGSSWTFQQKLTAPDSPAGNGNAFGDTVDISGDTVVVAAPQHSAPEPYSGGVYVFVRTGTTWSLQKRFTNADTPLVKFGKLGYSAAISGDTVLVTGFGFLEFSPHRDFVHVFVREGTTWTLQSTIITGADDSFDVSLAISGDMAVIGEPNISGTMPSAVNIYVRCGTEWTRQQRFLSPGPAFDNFGSSVAISGNTVIIGARSDQIGQNQVGSAYIFVSDGTTWTQQAKLTGGVHRLNFGHSVDILGDTVIVGAPDGTFQGGTQAGSAQIFVRNGTTWTGETPISAPDGQPSDGFGSGVAISSDTLIAGAPYDDFGSTQTNEGSAWAIDRTTAEPPPTESPCQDDIEVNIVTDQPDADLETDDCDVDVNQSGNQCSLRAAIQTANAKKGVDKIVFNIPGGGTHTISPLTQLPSLSETATIDATTQPGYSGTPLIELSGNSALGGIGFAAGSDNSILRGMAINRFGIGIGLQSSGVKVESCYFGLSPDGSPAGTTTDNIVAILISTAAASNNTIGGAGNLGNVLSNNGIGVGIYNGATGNKVFGNKIGTNTVGTSAIPNTFGAVIEASSGNKIGDTVAGTGNVISGSNSTGIYVRQGSSNNVIAGNLIGTNTTGTEAIANANGVIIEASNNNRVGSDTGVNGNVISGSTFTGVTLKTGATNNVIVANKIGTNQDGTAAIPNQFGVGVDDSANNNTIGDLVSSAKGNLISGNTNTGVVIQGNSASNRVSFNSIGTKANGTELIPSGEVGILLTGGATTNTLEANVIGGHILQDSGSGIGISASAGSANMVFDNFIGVARNGTTPLPNWFGIGIAADGQTIGSVSRKNLIGKNIKAGIVLSPATGNPQVENNTVDGNLIGTNGTDNVGNDEFGIWLNGAANDNTIKSNYVGGNVFVGIAVTDGSTSNDILDNRVGVNVGSSAAIPNGIGIWVRQSADNTISQNLVCGNDLGMLIGTNIGFGSTARAVEGFHGNSPQSNQGGTYTTGNTVQSNIIGIGPSGPIPNKMGIAIGENARNNFIGTAAGANLISGNTATIGYGMFLGTLAEAPTEDSLPQLNIIQRNYIGLSADLQSTVSNNIGFVLLQAKSNTIGGESDATANIIVASTQEGVSIRDGTRENTFLKNYVGVLPPGFGTRSGSRRISPNGSYGNGSHGILIENGASGNTLGGETSATGMVISDNGGNGIRVASNAGSGNRFGANSIFGNTLPGIDLGGDGVTPNDPTDADVGPNNLQNYPTFVFSISGGNLIVNYQVDSSLANSNYGATGLTVQFFEADGSGAGVGLLGVDQYAANDYTNGTPGWRKKNLGNAAALGFTPGDMMTATATDADGNSSEFSPPVSSVSSFISGTVTYGNAIGSPSPRFVSNVLMSGAGSTNVSTTTAAPGAIAGQYTLMGFGAGSYTVTPTKTGGVNNITSFDAARISQHVAGPPNPQLTGNQLLVADVSGNTSVTSFDAAMIAKFVAGPPYAAPGIGSTATWRFTPASKNYATVASSIAGEDYSALLMGEVSGNWNNSGARPARTVKSEQWTVDSKGIGSDRDIAVEVSQVTGSVDKEIVVAVDVQGVANKGVIAYEFELRYDPLVIQPLAEPVDLKNTSSHRFTVVTNAAEPGLLRVVVYGAYPIEGDGVLLNLRFTAVGSSGSISPISFERIMFNEGESRVIVTDGKVGLL